MSLHSTYWINQKLGQFYNDKLKVQGAVWPEYIKFNLIYSTVNSSSFLSIDKVSRTRNIRLKFHLWSNLRAILKTFYLTIHKWYSNYIVEWSDYGPDTTLYIGHYRYIEIQLDSEA